MNDNKSVATIDAPEFIEVTNISPMISKCQIKVFYLGKNRNGSYIDKETAIKMADTLRGNPIVAAYRSEKEDFGDHGEVIHIEDGEISFSCKTVPYGFVATDAEVSYLARVLHVSSEAGAYVVVAHIDKAQRVAGIGWEFAQVDALGHFVAGDITGGHGHVGIDDAVHGGFDLAYLLFSGAGGEVVVALALLALDVVDTRA